MYQQVEWTCFCSHLGYEQFGISRKGSQDNTDEYCTIFYEKEKVWHFWLIISVHSSVIKHIHPSFIIRNVERNNNVYWWYELPCIYWRWSLLKVAPFGCRNHHQFQEAFHVEQMHPALQHGQYPVMRCFSCSLLFYCFLSILVVGEDCCLNMVYTRFNSKD